MIRTVLYRKNGQSSGFSSSGHAGAGEYGYDIVCSAVSALTVNTANAVEALTGAKFSEQLDEEGGFLEFHLMDLDNHDAQLLLKALELGLRQISESYPENLMILEDGD
jgi:uncharacterized protein YsxB (DUF464 family)